MKKLTVAFLVCLLALSAVSCGKTDEETNDNTIDFNIEIPDLGLEDIEAVEAPEVSIDFDAADGDVSVDVDEAEAADVSIDFDAADGDVSVDVDEAEAADVSIDFDAADGDVSVDVDEAEAADVQIGF